MEETLWTAGGAAQAEGSSGRSESVEEMAIKLSCLGEGRLHCHLCTCFVTSFYIKMYSKSIQASVYILLCSVIRLQEYLSDGVERSM